MPRGWNYLEVFILEDGQIIGSYIRRYPSLYNTFRPFYQNGGVYALYSADYTTTRVMRLPACEDLGGEEPSSEGFCPADYYVPYLPDQGLVGEWGFLSGCVWGDDSSWKIRHINLSRASEGIIEQSEKFGYLPMPSRLSLRESVELGSYSNGEKSNHEIEFAARRLYSMKHGKFGTDWGDYDEEE